MQNNIAKSTIVAACSEILRSAASGQGCPNPRVAHLASGWGAIKRLNRYLNNSILGDLIGLLGLCAAIASTVFFAGILQ